MKATVGTKIDPELAERLRRVAAVDRRTVSNVLELCVLKGLPLLEEDLERRALIDRTSGGDADPVVADVSSAPTAAEVARRLRERKVSAVVSRKAKGE